MDIYAMSEISYKNGYEAGKRDARKKGQWIDGYAMHNGKKVYDSIDCSACEGVFKIESHDREYWKKQFEFCPYCGADMRGEEDG
jgi:hypothetical protein